MCHEVGAHDPSKAKKDHRGKTQTDDKRDMRAAQYPGTLGRTRGLSVDMHDMRNFVPAASPWLARGPLLPIGNTMADKQTRFRSESVSHLFARHPPQRPKAVELQMAAALVWQTPAS